LFCDQMSQPVTPELSVGSNRTADAGCVHVQRRTAQVDVCAAPALATSDAAVFSAGTRWRVRLASAPVSRGHDGTSTSGRNGRRRFPRPTHLDANVASAIEPGTVRITPGGGTTLAGRFRMRRGCLAAEKNIEKSVRASGRRNSRYGSGYSGTPALRKPS